MDTAFCAALPASRVVDRFLCLRTPEPLISCGLAGSEEFRAASLAKLGDADIGRGHIFVTRSKTPYEVRFSSPAGRKLEIIQVHIAVDQFSLRLGSGLSGEG